MSRFEVNPNFEPAFDRALESAMEQIAQELAAEGRRRAMWSNRAARTLYARVDRDATGPFVKFSTGGGLQNIAEDPKGPRFTRQGWARGVMQRHEVIGPAAESVIARGLDIRL